MSLTISFYNNNSERNSINKSLNPLVTNVTGDLVNECDVIRPVIRIKQNVLANSMTSCNYCHIKDFNRYYFVDSLVTVRTGIVELHLTVDPLYTYASQIASCVALIDRTEWEKQTVNGDPDIKMSNRYIFDGAFRTESGDWLIHHNFQDVATLLPHTILCTIAAAVDGVPPTP